MQLQLRAGARNEWAVHALKFEDKSPRVVRVTGVARTYTVTDVVAVKKLVEALDPLDKAMNECTEAPRNKRRRLSGKQPQGNEDKESSSSATEDSDTSSDESAKSVHAPTPGPSRPLPLPSAPSGFYTAAQLGVIGVDLAKSSRSQCKICSNRIEHGARRALYAWHCKRPHGYIHLGCVVRLDAALLPRSLECLSRELAIADSDDIRSVVRQLQKRVTDSA